MGVLLAACPAAIEVTPDNPVTARAAVSALALELFLFGYFDFVDMEIITY